MKNKYLIKLTLIFVLAISIFSGTLSIKANEDAIEESVVEEIEKQKSSTLNSDIGSNNDFTIIEDDKQSLGDAGLVLLSDIEEIEVGNIAQYQLYLSMDGRHESYTDTTLLIKLPSQIDDETIFFTQDLNSLKIMDVIPLYDVEQNTLTYYFEELSGGFETAINLNIQTKNGSPLNDVDLVVEAVLSGNDIMEKRTESKTTLVSNQNASVSNKLKGVLKDGKLQERISLKYQDEAVFSIGVSVNKFLSGSLAPKENTKVILEYTFAEGIEYVSDDSGVIPTSDGLTYRWEFDANQNEDNEYFFNVNFDITSKVQGDLSVFSTISNVAKVSITYIDDSMKDYTVKSTAMISPNFEYELAGMYDGGAYSSIFSGPSDGLGNVGWLNNDNISVTEGALLGWNFYLTPLYATSPEHGMNAYNVFFHPDENLKIRNMYSGKFYYRPSSAFAQVGLQPIEEPVYYSLSIKYTDSDEWVEGIESIVPETYYSASELGIDSERTVETMWFHFHNNANHIFWHDAGYGNTQDNSVFDLPAGLTTTNLRIWTTIDEGYTGSIESNAGIAFSGWNSKNNSNRIEAQSKNVPDELRVDTWQNFDTVMESRLQTKTAQVVAAPTGINRYVKSNISFHEAENNLIKQGDNLMKVEIINDSASTKSLVGPFETYVLVDQGVLVKDLESISKAKVSVVSDNFENTNKTLLKVVVTVDNLSYGSKTTVLIPVTITEDAPYNLDLEVIGYLDYDYEVSEVSNTNGTFTMKELENFDYNENGLVDEIYISRNQYTFINAYEYYGTHSASKDGLIYSQNIDVTSGQETSLKIDIHNTLKNPIKTFNLIGVLPDVSDTFVLSDKERNSKFSLQLTGPVQLPEAYNNHFEVLYSESKEPLVNGVLDKNTSSVLPKLAPIVNVDNQEWLKETEVNNFDDIKSYKIVMKNNVAPIQDEHFTFAMSIKMGEHNLTGKEDISERIAYSTYAVGINDASAFETQSVNFTYHLPSEYTINAKDVVMKLSEVRAMNSDGILENFVKTKALPNVLKDGIKLSNIDIMMEIKNIPKEIEVGKYPLEFTYVYDENLGSKVSTTTNLIVVNDDENIEEKPETPGTGIDNTVSGLYGIIVILSIAVIVLNKKRWVSK